jgi:hypothetical protein
VLSFGTTGWIFYLPHWCACSWVNDCNLVYMCAPACLCACVPVFRCLCVCASVHLCVFVSILQCAFVFVCASAWLWPRAAGWHSGTYADVCWHTNSCTICLGDTGPSVRFAKETPKKHVAQVCAINILYTQMWGTIILGIQTWQKIKSPIIIPKPYQTTFIRLTPATVPNLLLTQYLIYYIPDMSHWRAPNSAAYCRIITKHTAYAGSVA